jgi:hypothetical protein
MGLLLRQLLNIPQLLSMAKEAVLETVMMSYGDDGILRIKIKEGAVIGLAQAKLQFETIRRVCGDDKILALIDATASHTVTKEAQEFAAQNVGNRIATAVINPNPFSKITLNLFLRIFRPVTPFKSFSNEENAVKWLLEQRGNHS